MGNEDDGQKLDQMDYMVIMYFSVPPPQRYLIMVTLLILFSEKA